MQKMRGFYRKRQRTGSRAPPDGAACVVRARAARQMMMMIPFTNDRGLRDYRAAAQVPIDSPVWAPRWPWVLGLIAGVVGVLLLLRLGGWR